MLSLLGTAVNALAIIAPGPPTTLVQSPVGRSSTDPLDPPQFLKPARPARSISEKSSLGPDHLDGPTSRLDLLNRRLRKPIGDHGQ